MLRTDSLPRGEPFLELSQNFSPTLKSLLLLQCPQVGDGNKTHSKTLAKQHSGLHAYSEEGQSLETDPKLEESFYSCPGQWKVLTKEGPGMTPAPQAARTYTHRACGACITCILSFPTALEASPSTNSTRGRNPPAEGQAAARLMSRHSPLRKASHPHFYV